MLGLGHRVVAEPFFQGLDLSPHVEQRLEGQACFLDQRASAVGQAVLREIADSQA